MTQAMQPAPTRAWTPDPEAARELFELRQMVGACMQCGTCSASCPNQTFMDISPRRMWRMVQFGMLDAIEQSHTFWMCSSCYLCTLRCPRGLPLTQAMAALKRLAQTRRAADARAQSAFYRAFMDNARTYGRVQETALMQDFFLKRMNPLLPLSYLPLGLRMFRKGKLHAPKGTHKGVLEPLFAKAREQEEVRP